MCETIKIKYLPGSPRLEMNDKGDWCDLYVYQNINLKKGDFAYIPLGVAMKLPDGYEAILAPRSSTFSRTGLVQTNSIGVIDSSFCGDGDQWLWPAYATRDTTLKKGQRVCQFRIQKIQPQLIFQEVVSLDSEDRGGFGSTGE